MSCFIALPTVWLLGLRDRQIKRTVLQHFVQKLSKQIQGDYTLKNIVFETKSIQP